MKIFICYKFFGDESSPNNLIVKTIKDIIESEGMSFVAADVDESNDTTYDYIQASLWLSDACIVLAFNKEEEKYTGNLSVSQTHEIGFMHGQTKPCKILVQKDRKSQANFGNLPDHQFIIYDHDDTAVSERNRDYIGPKITRWLQSVRDSTSRQSY